MEKYSLLVFFSYILLISPLAMAQNPPYCPDVTESGKSVALTGSLPCQLPGVTPKPKTNIWTGVNFQLPGAKGQGAHLVLKFTADSSNTKTINVATMYYTACTSKRAPDTIKQMITEFALNPGENKELAIHTDCNYALIQDKYPDAYYWGSVNVTIQTLTGHQSVVISQ